jgi:dimethylaniline monooxygenase (N-oxide forming)
MLYRDRELNRTKEIIRKKIAVIGCGPSGIIVMKELLHAGNDVICFEKQSNLGGIYNHISQATRLTTSSLLTAFSEYSDNNENTPKFWTVNEYIEYLHGFSRTFQLQNKIHFNTEVKTIQYNNTIQQWEIDIEVTNTIPPIKYRIMVDGLAICSGMNSVPNIPQFNGQNKFRGNIIHSNEYHQHDFTNKRVLIIGAGETTSELSYEISKIASKTVIAIRDTHGHIVPRIQTQNYVSDLNTNRCRYSNPYILRNWIATITVLTQYISALLFSDLKTQSILKKISELNRSQKTSAFSKFGCKNEGIVKAIVLHNAELYKKTILEIHENMVIFNDGSIFDNCDYILLCTGYKQELSFLKQYHPLGVCTCDEPHCK